MLRLINLKRRPILIAIGTIAILTLYWFIKPQTIDQKTKLIKDLGGIAVLDVYCDHEGNQFPPQARAWWIEFKNWLFHPFHKIIYVQLRHTEISDDDLSVLEDFNNLIRLDIAGTKITDEGIESLSRLKKLKYLHLGNTEITQAGMARLQYKNRSLIIEGFCPQKNCFSDLINQINEATTNDSSSDIPQMTLELIIK